MSVIFLLLPAEQVRVVDPCAPEQKTCLESGKCSVLDKLCDALLVEQFSEGGGEPEEPQYVPEPDTTPPVLRHLGICTPPLCEVAVTASGTPVWVYHLQVGEEFQDPGVLALSLSLIRHINSLSSLNFWCYG